MNSIQKIILKKTAEQIKKVAFSASGTTSFWGAYQPKEPTVLSKNSFKDQSG